MFDIQNQQKRGRTSFAIIKTVARARDIRQEFFDQKRICNTADPSIKKRKISNLQGRRIPLRLQQWLSFAV